MANPVFPPNPNETVPPKDSFDAITSTLVGLTAEMPREVVIDHFNTMDTSSLVLSMQGFQVDGSPRLNPVEKRLSETIEYCLDNGLMQGYIDALAVIEVARDEVENGGVFVGTERPYSDYDRPPSAA